MDLLADPIRLAIDLAVMRGAKALKRTIFDTVRAKDKSGLGTISVGVQMLAEK